MFSPQLSDLCGHFQSTITPQPQIPLALTDRTDRMKPPPTCRSNRAELAPMNLRTACRVISSLATSVALLALSLPPSTRAGEITPANPDAEKSATDSAEMSAAARGFYALTHKAYVPADFDQQV